MVGGCEGVVGGGHGWGDSGDGWEEGGGNFECERIKKKCILKNFYSFFAIACVPSPWRILV